MARLLARARSAVSARIESMGLYPMLASGLVLAVPPEGRAEVSGTGFCPDDRQTIVTAAHCVPEAEGVRCGVTGNLAPEAVFVAEIRRHPKVDVAVMRRELMDGDEGMAPQVFELAPERGLTDGQDVSAYGYPSEGGPDGIAPVGRMFKGHLMRIFQYDTAAGRDYLAGETSFPIPAAASGGPVIDRRVGHLVGVMTTNVDSYVVVDQVDEIDEAGYRTRIESKRIVSYGLIAMATRFDDWLGRDRRAAW